jgi:predicted nucleotidyltransferase
MDLTSPLRSLIPSLDSAVLEVLAGTESSLSLAQVARVAPRGSRPGLALAMGRLVEHGQVTATPANRGEMYRLNREHVLAESVLTASRARSTILARIGEHVARMEPQPVHVSVFGSFARREAGPASDIDLLFVLPAPPDDEWYDQVSRLDELVQAWTGNRVEYLAFSVGDLARVVQRQEPIVESWLADGVTVHGPAIESVVRDAADVERVTS